MSVVEAAVGLSFLHHWWLKVRSHVDLVSVSGVTT